MLAPSLITKIFWVYIVVSLPLCVHAPSCCTLGRLVTRERFGLAHAPLLLIKTYGHSYVSFVSFCYALNRLVTRERFGLAHEPLLLIKTYRHSCVSFCVFLLYVRPSCDEEAFWACPCTSLPHKDVHALVCALCVFLVCLTVLWRGSVSGLPMHLSSS